MVTWVEEVSCFGAGIAPAGHSYTDGYLIERDRDEHGRWRVTFEVNGQKVTHTFDMGKRWEKRFGTHPYDAAES